MRYTVFHKGLLLVGLPVLLEIVLLIVLSGLLALTDNFSKLEELRRDMTNAGSRLVIADCDTGLCLVRTWVKRDMNVLQEAYKSIEQSRKYTTILQTLNKVRGHGIDPLLKECLEENFLLIGHCQKMADITAEGFSFPAFARMMQVNALMLDQCHRTFRKMRTVGVSNEREVARTQSALNLLRQTQWLALVIGSVLNVGAALFLWRFFARQIIARLETMSRNIDLMSQRQPLLPQLSGSDEIAGLDRAFHQANDELTSADERELAMFNNTSDIICVIDNQLNCTRINKAVERLLGLTPNHLAGRGIDRVIAPADWGRFTKELNGARAAYTPASFEVDAVCADGSTIQTLWSACWSFRHQRWYCIAHDISEQKLLDKLKEAFIQMVASDLQRPLHAISDRFDALTAGRYGTLPARAQETATNGIKTLTRLVSLVDELLHLEQLQSRELRLNKESQPVRSTLLQSVSDVSALAANRRISITVDCPDTLKWTVDASAITRVLVNFLSNAIKFSPDGATIELRAVSDNRTTKVLVCDHGRGIPANVKNTLFQAFQQVQSSDGKRGKGTGLGLVISKRIVEQHGGEVGVDSQEGEGSTFWFALPPTATTPAHTTDSPTAPRLGHSGLTLQEPIPAISAPTRALWQAPVGRLNLRSKAALLIGIPLLLSTVFIGLMTWFLLQDEAVLVSQLRHRLVSGAALKMTTVFYRITVSLRHRQYNAEEREYCQTELKNIPMSLERFANNAGFDPMARDRAPRIISECELLYEMQKDHVEARNDPSHHTKYSSASMMELVRRLGHDVSELLDACESRDRMSPVLRANMRRDQVVLILSGLLANIATAGALAAFFSADLTRRLHSLSDNAARLSAGQALKAPVSGTDEVAVLDRAFHDMATALSEARQKEHAFLDSTTNIICTLDAEGRFTAANHAVTDLLEIQPADLQGRALSTLMTADESKSKAWLNESMHSTEPIGFETTLAGPSKTIDALFALSWSPREHTYFAIVHDISRRKELERIKREFLAVISHDLRTPLTTISGVAVLLLNGAFGAIPEEAKPILTDVTKQTDDIVDIINDLLDLEKLEAGQMKLDLTATNLPAIMQKAQDLLSQRKRIVPIDFQQPLENTEISGDTERLAQAFAHLILEASSLSPSAIHVLVDTTAHRIKVNLRCEGSQASSLAIQSLIERLSASAAPGTLGVPADHAGRLRMPLARRIVESHHGEVLVGATTQGELSLDVYLPLAAPSVSQAGLTTA